MAWKRGHPLEGSCQENKLPLYPTFCIFGAYIWPINARMGSVPLYASVFSLLSASVPSRVRTSHPSGSRRQETPPRGGPLLAPGIAAPENPRYHVVSICKRLQIRWFPCGSNPCVAHGMGVPGTSCHSASSSPGWANGQSGLVVMSQPHCQLLVPAPSHASLHANALFTSKGT
jgi:hypothetical protein